MKINNKVLVSFLVAFIVIAGVSALWYWSAERTSQENGVNDTDFILDGPEIHELLERSIALSFDGEHEQSIASVQEYLDTVADSDDEYYDGYIYLGAAYMNAEDYAAATEAYLSAYDIQPAYGSANGVAVAAEQAGDIDTAVEYYRLSIPHLQELHEQGDPMAEPTIADTERKIDELEGGNGEGQ